MIYRCLATKYGYTPNQIANMTPAQQILLLSEETKDTTGFNEERELARFLTGLRNP